MPEFNYGESQMKKLDMDMEWRVKFIASDEIDRGETHWMNLTDNQKRVMYALMVEFKEENRDA